MTLVCDLAEALHNQECDCNDAGHVADYTARAAKLLPVVERVVQPPSLVCCLCGRALYLH